MGGRGVGGLRIRYVSSPIRRHCGEILSPVKSSRLPGPVPTRILPACASCCRPRGALAWDARAPLSFPHRRENSMRALGRSTLLLAVLPVALVAQQVNFASSAPQRLRVTTSSEEASRHFWAGLSDARNIFFSRAASHFDRAASLDPNLGLARVFRASVAPGLSTEERKAEVDRGIATMTSASTV